MNWLVTIPLMVSIAGAALKYAGKDIGWLWVMLPMIGILVCMVGVVALAGLQAMPGILGKLQMLTTFLAVPVTTIASLVKIIQVLM